MLFPDSGRRRQLSRFVLNFFVTAAVYASARKPFYGLHRDSLKKWVMVRYPNILVFQTEGLSYRISELVTPI